MGIAYDFAEIDPTLVDHMLKSAWYDKNYSKRIWGNAQNLGNELKDQLMLGAIMGKTHKEMSQTLQDKFAVGAANCERLVRTEQAARQRDTLMHGKCFCILQFLRYKLIVVCSFL